MVYHIPDQLVRVHSRGRETDLQVGRMINEDFSFSGPRNGQEARPVPV